MRRYLSFTPIFPVEKLRDHGKQVDLTLGESKGWFPYDRYDRYDRYQKS